MFGVWAIAAKNWLTFTTEGIAVCEVMGEMLDDKPYEHDDCLAAGDRVGKVKRWVDEAEESVDEEEGEEEAEGREEPDFTREELCSSLRLFFQ